jgi:hypothetical protein
MGGMLPARIAAVLVLVVSYGALSARQPAVRTAMPLPSGTEQLAASLGITAADRNQLLPSIVRTVFDAPDGSSARSQQRRSELSSQLRTPTSARPISVPLPLDKSIWRETILAYPLKDGELAAAILSDRSTALLYYGLAALDDDTLGWLGPDRETLLHLRRNAAPFAAFGRSIRIRGGRVSVPGGRDAEPIWTAIVGADPERPSMFVQRLFRSNGRLAWFYDTIQHLDPDHQRLVFGNDDAESMRIERTRALLDVFESAAPEWRIPDRPFERPALGPAVVVSLAAVNDSGGFSGPDSRKFWELIFRDRGDAAGADFSDQLAQDRHSLEPSWLARRISLVPAHLGQARLETFLFAQRRFSERGNSAAIVALRGVLNFPALSLTLERIGITDVATYAAAARTAAALNAIRSAEWRAVAITEFQASLAMVDAAIRRNRIDREAGAALTSSLIALPISATQGYGDSLVDWLRQHESTMLGENETSARLSEELAEAAGATTDSARLPLERLVANTLTSFVYATYPDRVASLQAAEAIARRHNLGTAENPTGRAWQLPRKERGQLGDWRVSGSLLGLDVPLGRLSLPAHLPAEAGSH